MPSFHHSASGFSNNSNELKQHNQHEQEDNNSLHSYYYGYRDGSYNLAPTTPEYSNTPASESAFFFGGEERNGFSSVSKTTTKTRTENSSKQSKKQKSKTNLLHHTYVSCDCLWYGTI